MAVAAAAVAVPATLLHVVPVRVVPRGTVVRPPQRVIPPQYVPAVEPAEFQAVDPADARAFNATVPFVTGPNPPAAPFRFRGTADDRARALACLSAAVLYEAGDDPTGQRAVAQVVLNRVRHPAFPNSICGVVFQGAERRTGCQFTFTCDGALARTYPQPFWDRALAVARAAIDGRVDRPVGYATHYHTDWVVPYWSSSLDKIAAVDTHLFFRWTGWWGTPAAFRRSAGPVEPRVVQLANRFDEHKLPEVRAAEAEVAALLAADATARAGGIQPLPDDPNSFAVALDPTLSADALETLAKATCGDRPYCKFLGWRDAASVPSTAAAISQPATIAAMSFSYLRDRAQPIERTLWNCRDYQRPPLQCMRRAPPAPGPAPTRPSTPPSELKATQGVLILDGVRRPAPAPSQPSPSAK